MVTSMILCSKTEAGAHVPCEKSNLLIDINRHLIRHFYTMVLDWLVLILEV